MIQDRADPTHFVPVKIYRTVEGTVCHKETTHYAAWRANSARLATTLRSSLRLPTEQEWVKAARGWDDRLYPWGGQAYQVGYANVDETKDKTGPHYLRETSPVGMYPHAASPFGVEELSGNVWEYCLNKYAKPDDLSLGGDDRRAMRGGLITVKP